jgi:hypothetical protein
MSDQAAAIWAPDHRRRSCRHPIGTRSSAISSTDGTGLIAEPQTRKMMPTGNHS